VQWVPEPLDAREPVVRPARDPPAVSISIYARFASFTAVLFTPGDLYL